MLFQCHFTTELQDMKNISDVKLQLRSATPAGAAAAFFWKVLDGTLSLQDIKGGCWGVEGVSSPFFTPILPHPPASRSGVFAFLSVNKCLSDPWRGGVVVRPYKHASCKDDRSEEGTLGTRLRGDRTSFPERGIVSRNASTPTRSVAVVRPPGL